MDEVNCDQYPGRLKDLCLGYGLDGRPNPSDVAVAKFRHSQHWPKLETPEPRPERTPEPEPEAVSQIGSRLKQHFRDSVGAFPCAACADHIRRLNAMTADEAESQREVIISEISLRAFDTMQTWWQKAAVIADQCMHTGGVNFIIGQLFDMSIREEREANNATA